MADLFFRKLVFRPMSFFILGEDGRLRLCFAQPHNHLLNHQKTAAAEEAAEEGRDLEDTEREEEEDGEDGEDGKEAFIEQFYSYMLFSK
ncbi:hypothetical protein Nepgr_009172 [Nepenthes gracilis]|uniref:Uncharacterized protein n=1 Tax=Nepenthes gracilis TaxID=150966 RepID=A0AAD3XJX3_NEPGR|nr:hypothetical protein Nepgr_009172 [Nepenthes gracilis]